jgi:hypothetical protein
VWARRGWRRIEDTNFTDWHEFEGERKRGVMNTQEIVEAVMALPEKERLELARRIVASITAEQHASSRVAEAVKGIEDVVSGKVNGLSEAEFRNALK